MILTAKHRKNLLKLAEGLRRSVPPPAFDIGGFMETPERFENEPQPRGVKRSFYSECGATACAVGHGPLFGIKVSPNDDTWFDYCERVFGVQDGDPVWDWLFDSEWVSIDNTPQGAAARILFLLEHGFPPRQYNYVELIAPYLATEQAS